MGSGTYGGVVTSAVGGREAAVSRPWSGAMAVLVVLAVPAVWRSVGVVSAVMTVAAIAALAWFPRRPGLALVGALALLFGALALGQGRQVVPVALVLLVVALGWWTGRRRLAVLLTAGGGVFMLLVAVRISEVTGQRGTPVDPSVSGLMLASLLAAAALAGSVVRVRGQYRVELEARARQLEVERDQRARIAVAAERRRIAHEMHDVVAHSVTVMVRLAEGVVAGRRAHGAVPVESSTASEAARDREDVALRALADTGRGALAEMRRLLGVLADGEDSSTPEGLVAREPQPSVADLDRLVQRLRAAGLAVTATVEGSLEGWGPGAELAVYRIAQEALTNALRHAPPGAAATLRVSATDESIEVLVVDDGAGHRAAQPAPGHGGSGLTGMAERVAPWGGTVEAGPTEPHGWRVWAVLHTATA